MERQEGVPLDPRDAVALGDLAVAHTHGSRSTHREPTQNPSKHPEEEEAQPRGLFLSVLVRI